MRLWPVPEPGFHALDLLHHSVGCSVRHHAEYHMFVIEVPGRHGGYEKLGAVCVRSRVRHAQEPTRAERAIRMRDHAIGPLIIKLGSIDGLAAGAVARREVTTLQLMYIHTPEK